MNAKPTLKELASMTGCSLSTVSRAISHPEKVSYATKKKVEAAIDEYQSRNEERRSGLIGIIVPEVKNEFFPLMLDGINEASSKQDTTFLLTVSENDPKMEDRILKRLIDLRVDGIIMSPCGRGSAFLKSIVADNIIPIVFLDRDPGFEDEYLVNTNNRDGMFQMTRYLISLGHRKIVFLGGVENTSTSNERVKGFMEAHAEAGLSADRKDMLYCDYSFTKAHDRMKEILEKYDGKPPFTAVCAANDMMAAGASKAISEAGLKIPDDISITGYDDIPNSAYMGLTTVRQPFHDMGRTACFILLRQILGQENPRKKITHQSYIVIRSSCMINRNAKLEASTN